MKILHVVGARPNFIKAASVFLAISQYPEIQQVIVHTGQHYDAKMSRVFFQELGLPEPRHNLEVGSESHTKQTAEIMLRFESPLLQERPDWVLVYGDVNSTIAAALVCSKLGFKVAHVEAGLRSLDRSMPEEINRLLTDHLSDLLFTPSRDANENLEREGISSKKVHCVGNVMIDTLLRMLPRAQEQPAGIRANYALVTLHRPSNVDDLEWLGDMFQALVKLSRDLPVIWPLHPRTRERVQTAGFSAPNGNMHLMDPLPYIEFLTLQRYATVVITDSGGIQEETTFLQIPCLTMRNNTERPITVELGTNHLAGRDPAQLGDAISRILDGKVKRGQIPPLWDGQASQRIADILMKHS
jgi:UDP-N-acetylglucosamine 2-epimerase (non-hydrolysing)